MTIAGSAAAPAERSVDVNGHPCRVWEKGSGEPVGFLPGFGGVPRWTPFLDRLAARRRVIAPSLPGFPGALGADQLDDLTDWVAATLDLLEGAGLAGADLIGASVGGMLAAEVAALSRATVKRVVLVAPFGLFDADRPTADPFAATPEEVPALLAANPAALAERHAPPEGSTLAAAEEWAIVLARAAQAAARLLWPLGDRGLVKRLHRIVAPTLVVWGTADRLIPPSYAGRFASGIQGLTEIRQVPGAGHLVDLDAPDALADLIDEFLAR
jgi:pimeloyl-ACP methyl ester carboxylesterase